MESIFQGIKILEMFYKGLQIALILLIFLINFSGGELIPPPKLVRFSSLATPLSGGGPQINLFPFPQGKMK